MRSIVKTVTFLIAVSLPGWASADVYKCTDHAGRVRYQNMACAGEDGPAIVSPGPGSTYTGPVRALSAAPPPPPPPSAASEGLRPAVGGPVDTRTFGMLEIGSSERTVIAKLGQPDRVFEAARTFVPVRRAGGGVELREKVRSAWVYDSDGLTLRTVLYFEDGALVKKEKHGR